MSIRPLFWISLLLIASSCVSSKVHKDLQSRFSELEEEVLTLRRDNRSLEERLSALDNDLNKCREERQALRSDTARVGRDLRKMQRNYADLNRSYEFLLENNNALLTNSARENKKMLERLQELDMRLQDKGDSLETERQALDELTLRLQDREARVEELESIIRRQDSTVNYIQSVVRNALKNYEGKGLTVEERDGKVYISLDNRLLFPSAQWSLNENAKAALQSLAQVLAENPDLSITVEGHTDSDAFRGRSEVADNWDLSVMRATAVVKELTENKDVDPARIIASGRGEYLPLVPNDSDENKARNRRTEVILTPDYSELGRLMDELGISAKSKAQSSDGSESE